MSGRLMVLDTNTGDVLWSHMDNREALGVALVWRRSFKDWSLLQLHQDGLIVARLLEV